MSIAEQLIKAKNNLDNSRKVIAYKHGNINEVAAFDNLASEIESIPSGDANYLLVNDTDIAYKKQILVGASELVKVKKIGGKTIKSPNPNLVPLDNIYPVKSKNYNTGEVIIDGEETYWMSFRTIPLSVGTYSYAIMGEDGKVLDSPQDGSFEGTFTVTTDGEVKGIDVLANGPLDNWTIYVMCWKSSTIPTIDDFVPYGIFENVKVTELRSEGANLFDMSTLRVTINAKTLNEDGSLTVVNNATSAISSLREMTKQLPAGTYTINNISGDTMYVQFAMGDYSNQITVGNKCTFTYDGTSYLKLLCADQPAGTTKTYKWMLNYGTTAAPYMPYSAEPIDTFSVPDIELNGINERVYDYIDLENGTIVKASPKIVFDGSDDEDWERDTVGTYTSRFSIPFSEAKSGGAGLCSNDNYVSSGIGDDKELCCCYSDRFFYRVPNTIVSVEQFKKWISQNPITLFYEAKKPDATDISDILPADTYIKVQAGGSIVAVNKKKKEEAVPTDITYIRRIV